MQHEFKVNGEKVEVTIAKDGQSWLLGEHCRDILRWPNRNNQLKRRVKVCSFCKSR